MRTLALAFVTSVGVAVAALAAPSCKPLPDGVCAGDSVNALVDDGGTTVGACSTCMQQTKCCEPLGRCQADNACTVSFESTQSCIIEGGAGAEATCKSKLTTQNSRDLYNCIRPLCGNECGIPSCDLDPSVVLFGNSTCDGCITGSCCQPINDCYQNRHCKLFLECITDHCPRTTGISMTVIGALPKDLLSVATANACGDAGAPDRTPGFDPGPCLDRCLDEFAPTGGTEDQQAARCLAVGVYTCGAAAGCGPKCTNLAATNLPGPYPEDDAGASAVDAGDSGATR